MAELYHTIYVQQEIDPDSLIAIFVLKEFGDFLYPGIGQAKIDVVESMPENKNGWALDEEGIVSFHFDDAKFPFREQLSLTKQVLSDLKIKDEALNELVKIAEDKEGQNDYNFYEILANLVKEHQVKPSKVFGAAILVLKPHYESLRERLAKLPTEYMRCFDEGRVEAFVAKQKRESIRVLTIESDEAELAPFLHNRKEIQADIVAQKFSSGKINVTSKHKLRIDLTDVVAVLRLDEARKRKLPFDRINWNDLRVEGRMEKIAGWNYDSEIGGIFFTGMGPKREPSQLELVDLKKALLVGLDFNNFDTRCPEQGCRGKKCRYYFYNLLRCRKRRMNDSRSTFNNPKKAA